MTYRPPRPRVKRLAALLLVSGATIALSVLAHSLFGWPTSRASSEPIFQLPFPCGEPWTAATYTENTQPGGHLPNVYAVDFNAPEDNGRRVLAGADGGVAATHPTSGTTLGNYVDVSYPGDIVLRFAHLAEITVTDGAEVHAHTEIGRVGDSGLSGSPPPYHLHYEQRLNGEPRAVVIDGRTWTYGGPGNDVEVDPDPYIGTPHTSNNCSPSDPGDPSTALRKPIDLPTRVPWQAGVSARITHGYGQAAVPGSWYSLRFSVPAGTNVVAATIGDVLYAGPATGRYSYLGNIVVLRRTLGDGYYYFLYTGLATVQPPVSFIDPNRVLGTAGSNGLGFALYKDAQFISGADTGLVGGTPVYPEPMFGAGIYDQLTWWSASLTMTAKDVASGVGNPGGTWHESATVEGARVAYGDAVKLVAHVTGTVALQEVRFTAYYDPPGDGTWNLSSPGDGFDPQRTWPVLAVCRPSTPAGAYPSTPGCTWNGSATDAIVSFEWEPHQYVDPQVPWLPTGDRAIRATSEICVPARLSFDVYDTAGYRRLAPGGVTASNCGAASSGALAAAASDLAWDVAPTTAESAAGDRNVFLQPRTVPSCDTYWIGPSGNWGDESMWTAGVPGNAGVACFAGGSNTVTIERVTEAHALIVGGSTSVTLRGADLILALGGANRGTLTLGANSDIAATDGGVVNHGTLITTDGQIEVRGDFENTGTLDIRTPTSFRSTSGTVGEFDNSGTVQVAEDASLSVAGDWHQTDGSVVAGGPVSMGTFHYTDGTISGHAFELTSLSIAPTAPSAHTYYVWRVGSLLSDLPAGNIVFFRGDAWLPDGFVNDGSITFEQLWETQSAWLRNFGSVTNNGSMAIGPGRTSLLLGGSLTNNGTLSLAGADTPGSLQADGGVVNHGTLITTDGQIEIRGDFENTGTLDIRTPTSFRSTSGTVGEFDNSGTVQVAEDASLSVAGDWHQTDGSVVLATGSNLWASGLMDIRGGTLSGTGTITGSVRNAGTIGPGASPGTLTISGPYTQTSTGRLEVELTGTASSAYDRLVVSGAATLDGTLALTTSGFTPAVGNTFAFLSAGSRTGRFATVDGLSPGGGVAYQPTYSASGASLSVVDQRPAVTLSLPALTNSTSVGVTLSASDPSGTGIAGWYLSTSAAAPLPADSVWLAAKPTTFSLPAGDGAKTIYAWAKDNAGGVSGTASAQTLLDTTPPSAGITAPATTTTRQVRITLSGTDTGSGINGWFVTESAAPPALDNPAWVTDKPTSFTLSTGSGAKTIYAWTRDAARNRSTAASATLTRITAPSAPTNVSATPGNGSADVAWSVPASDGGSAITGYTVTSNPDSRTCTTSGALSCMVSGLTNGIAYTFTVRATNHVGTGPASSPSNSVTPSAPPADTTGPTVELPTGALFGPQTLGTTAQLRLFWPAASDPSGIARYQLQSKKGTGRWLNVVLASRTATSAEIALSPNATYRFRLRAVDGAGNRGAWTTTPAGKLRLVQETAGAITYTGSWRRVALAGASGGYVRYAGAAGRVARYSFTGTSVAFVSTLAKARGMAEVWLDGVKVTTIDLYAPTITKRAVAWASGPLASGRHTLEIRLPGSKRQAATSTRVDLDAFLVWP